MIKGERIRIFMGHYGSGKTSIAVNSALMLRASGADVTIADLDIVNPYFRTTDSREALQSAGIELIASQFAGSNLDIPALPKELYSAICDESSYAIMDIGGDDRGAVALGRYAPEILKRGYLGCFVVNFYRPLTTTAKEALEVLREVEAASGIRMNALINNSNLGQSTTAEDVMATVDMMKELSSLSGLEIYATAVEGRIYEELRPRLDDLLPLKLGGLAVELNRQRK